MHRIQSFIRQLLLYLIPRQSIAVALELKDKIKCDMLYLVNFRWMSRYCRLLNKYLPWESVFRLPLILDDSSHCILASKIFIIRILLSFYSVQRNAQTWFVEDLYDSVILLSPACMMRDVSRHVESWVLCRCVSYIDAFLEKCSPLVF